MLLLKHFTAHENRAKIIDFIWNALIQRSKTLKSNMNHVGARLCKSNEVGNIDMTAFTDERV